MKKIIVLAAACLALGACSHKPTHNNNVDNSRANGTPVATTTTTDANTGTTSATTTSSSSLGAVSSGRGH